MVSFAPSIKVYIDENADENMNEDEKVDLGSDFLITKIDDIFKAHEEREFIKNNFTEILQQIDHEIEQSKKEIQELRERKQLNLQMMQNIKQPTKEEIIKLDLCQYYLYSKDFMRAKLAYTEKVDLKKYTDEFVQNLSLKDCTLQTILPLFELVRLSGVNQTDSLIVWYFELKNRQFEIALKEISQEFDLSETATVPFLRKFIEWFRVYITETMSSFNIIFTKVSAEHSRYLTWYSQKQTMKFLTICKEELTESDDIIQFHGICLQLMYCGMYLKQYELDFRQNLNEFIKNRVFEMCNIHLTTASEYFVDQIERINGLNPKNPIAAHLINLITTEKVDVLSEMFKKGDDNEITSTPNTPSSIRFAESPPQVLLDFPLLATCLNSILAGLNVLYIMPILDIHRQVGNSLSQCLNKIGEAANSVYLNNKNYLLAEHVFCVLHALRHHFLPYVIKALTKGIYSNITEDRNEIEAAELFGINISNLYKILEASSDSVLKKDEISAEDINTAKE
eukprot:NODE_63_length_26141_cov_1.022656.p4 type:complete len:509 gc:universal NODE_63_length_26141_cov_1.022656:22076-20550(-)